MDTNQTLDDDLSDNLDLNTEIRGYLQETAKWGYFLAIVGFIFLGLMVILAFSIGSIFASFFGGQEMPYPSFILTFMYLLFALLYFFPMLYLYRFANYTKSALRSNDQVNLVAAFSNQKSLYKFFGIFMAIVLGFYALMFLIMLVSGGASMLG